MPGGIFGFGILRYPGPERETFPTPPTKFVRPTTIEKVHEIVFEVHRNELIFSWFTDGGYGYTTSVTYINLLLEKSYVTFQQTIDARAFTFGLTFEEPVTLKVSPRTGFGERPGVLDIHVEPRKSSK